MHANQHFFFVICECRIDMWPKQVFSIGHLDIFKSYLNMQSPAQTHVNLAGPNGVVSNCIPGGGSGGKRFLYYFTAICLHLFI